MAETTNRARARAEQRRRELAARQQKEARRRLLIRILVPVAVVVVVVGVFVGLKVAGVGGSTSTSKPGVVASGAAPSGVVQGVTTVPASTFDAVGVGTAKVFPSPIADAPALTADGKPRVLYVGAEYCPYCAAERWAVVAALSRFGDFSKLGQTNSAAGDVYPNTATLSFHGASYTSDRLSFTGYETTTNQRQGNGYAPLDQLSAADEALVQKYDAAPYVPANSAGAIPFIDFGGKYLVSGSSYDPQVLQGKTHEQIAAALKDPGTDIAKAVDGTANAITAALCTLTGNQPGSVCSSSGVKAAAAKLTS